ncbi:MAG: M1 family metallopeptidase, partial [Deltaproteobacteria bacterium]|nr:M1 family metallopeptidase [Deltaproteobacteria bacterium]
QKTFQGTVTIQVTLEKPRQLLWLHGNELTVRSAQVTPQGGQALAARYHQAHPDGVAKLVLPSTIGPGKASLSLTFAGAFSTQLDGLYRVSTGGEHYAFTQMEAVWTRRAFPCFDEPAFKTPYDIEVIARQDHQVIGNTRQTASQALGDGKKRVTFATTEPLPSYLIAFAVGPLDVVAAPDIAPNAQRQRPLPFRGVAAKGRGGELAYALQHTPAILAELEDYFGSPYPYDKLDIIAVPDKHGAMENVGAVTFREWLLLFDEKRAPIAQRRAFAYVMAHELAHMWFGNLVTMPWWDDLWLNEAFATWMGHRAVHRWRPDYQALVRQLSGVQRAMAVDSLVHTRQIRQPVANNDDIHNAFDAITYSKGGGVLAMFERWLGPERFRKGLQAFMHQHRHGTATADDLLAALSAAADKDVATPFRTFLLQPGVPNIDVTLTCSASGAALSLTQSRYLPLGSTGDAAQTWQIPVCVRYAVGKQVQERCTLLATRSGTLELGPSCPDWVLPNAHAAGYYHFSLPSAELTKLSTTALPHLEPREKMSLASAVIAAFNRGKIDGPTAFATLEPLAADPHPQVAQKPMALIDQTRRWLRDDPLRGAVEAYGRKLYGPTYRRLGWQSAPGETPERQLLRKNVINFLASTARDPDVRKAAAARGRRFLGQGADGKLHRDAVSPDLAAVVLRMAGEEADETLFDACLTHLGRAQDEDLRVNLLGALGAVRRPKLARRALALTLDPRLKINEMMTPLWIQLWTDHSRDAAWRWLESNIDPLTEKLSSRGAGWLPGTARVFCSEEKARAAHDLFAERVTQLSGGPRELDKALESIRLCAARRQAQLASVRRFFEAQRSK